VRNTNSFDVLVIGSGLAGICAAAAALSGNARVGLISTGPGTFALGSACIDLEELHLDQPFTNPVSKDALQFFLALTAAAGCPYRDQPAKKLIPTALGTFRAASLTPVTAWAGNPDTSNKALILGIKGLNDFNSSFLAETLTYQAESAGWRAKYHALTLTVDNLPPAVTSLELARWLDQEEFRRQFISLIKPLIKDYDQVLLPGILGLNNDDQVLQAFQAELGCPVCEIPTLPPSVPGLRIYQHLLTHLQNFGAVVLSGYPATRIELEKNAAAKITIATPGRPRIVKTNAVIMAAGRGDHYRLEINPGPVIVAPVKVNEELQVVDNNRVIAGNLFAAGSIIDSGTARNGNAMAILTGYLAGNRAFRGEANNG
jgi:glycerol-3-phosphate dehydrogenase subunit B